MSNTEAEPKKSSGLAGVVAGKSSVAFIDGEKAILRYRGYDIHDLADHSTFEETVYLLWNGELPNRADLADFTTSVAEIGRHTSELQSQA